MFDDLPGRRGIDHALRRPSIPPRQCRLCRQSQSRSASSSPNLARWARWWATCPALKLSRRDWRSLWCSRRGWRQSFSPREMAPSHSGLSTQPRTLCLCSLSWARRLTAATHPASALPSSSLSLSLLFFPFYFRLSLARVSVGYKPGEEFSTNANTAQKLLNPALTSCFPRLKNSAAKRRGNTKGRSRREDANPCKMTRNRNLEKKISYSTMRWESWRSRSTCESARREQEEKKWLDVDEFND